MRAGGVVKCPEGLVYIPNGSYDGKAVGPLCADRSEFTNEMGDEVQSTMTDGYQLVKVSRDQGVGSVLEQ